MSGRDHDAPAQLSVRVDPVALVGDRYPGASRALGGGGRGRALMGSGVTHMTFAKPWRAAMEFPSSAHRPKPARPSRRTRATALPLG
ncbi:hypothetical protein ABIA33_005014 [Streptacidiphilus sp. MAP12-16]